MKGETMARQPLSEEYYNVTAKFRIPGDLWEIFCELCAHDRTTASQKMREMICNYINKRGTPDKRGKR